jgi:hypothetical protein
VLVRPASESCPALLKVDVAVPPKYAVPVFEKSVDDAFENVCSAVHVLALLRLRETVRAAEPSYEPENVSEVFPAVSAFKVPPRLIPEIVEFVSPVLFKVPVTVFGEMVNVPPELVTLFESVSPLKVVAVDVARVIAPVCALPYVCCTESTPVLESDPPES